MGSCVIFCAGGFNTLAEDIKNDDLTIAADGGLVHTQALGIVPKMVLGDFDSLGYTPEGANVFPVEKDDTDSMLAIRQGLKRGFRRFVLYGSLDGPRLDHTLANLQSLLFLAERGAVGYLVGERYIATTVSEETVLFPETCKGILSLFCFGADAQGVSLTGLQYPLENGTLTPGFPLGVSNHFVGTQAAVTVKKGCLIAIYDKANGLIRR